jgi:hypothetical protein
MKPIDRQAIKDWADYVAQIRAATPVEHNEPYADKLKRIAKLEADFEAWAKYYFPKFSFAEPAEFHKKSSRKFLKEDRIVHSRKWARGLSKSTRRMMEVLYKIFAQKCRLNILLISKSETNAIRLLAPYKGQLEGNQRLINDYGTQVTLGKWTEDEFVTQSGCAFRAVGANQNPRGARLDELRINGIIFDDIDDDEVCRNTDRLDERWQWIQEAVIPTVDISAPYFIVFDNNVIAEDSIAVRAAKIATYSETVNIRDENGISTWPQKNSEEDIDFILSIISYESGQKEYFNNPMSAGKTFPEVHWGACPPISSLPFVVIYADPASSNKDKPRGKKAANNSMKAVFAVGSNGSKFYIYSGFLDNMSNSDFIECAYQTFDNAARAKIRYVYIENNTLQDPFYSQVLMPLIVDKGKGRECLPVVPDTRSKPDKWFRIEANLEPINRLGNLIFNIAEQNNPHLKRLEAQFKSAKPTSSLLDGPDCIEGAVFIIKQKMANITSAAHVQFGKRIPHSKKY